MVQALGSPDLQQRLQQRLQDDWLIGVDATIVRQRFRERLHELQEFQARSSRLPAILLIEPDPANFLAGFLAAAIGKCPLFLGNPHWAESEWRQSVAIAQPDWIWGLDTGEWQPKQPTQQRPEAPTAQPWIMIPTGGTSGQVRFAIHTWATLMASVQGFQSYFQVDRVHSCCMLPLYHVSGLMQLMRSFLSGGKLAIVSFKTLQAGVFPSFDPQDWFISLVPTQLERSLQLPDVATWLTRFQTVLLGGAPPWDALLTAARTQQIRLAPTYGMTETASQIATLKPEDFLRGQTGCGQSLPHAQVQIQDEQGRSLGAHQIGQIVIHSQSLALGYYPDRSLTGSFLGGFPTDDRGFLDPQGNLHIVGRSSRKIITGGENVFPAEVEAAIRSTGLVQDVCVLGLPDRQWGERVTAVYVARDPASLERVETAIGVQLQATLSKFKHPKRWIAVDQLPRNAQGKLNWQQIRAAIALSEARRVEP